MDENLLGCYIKDSKGQLGSFRVKQEVLNRRRNIYTSRPKVRHEKNSCECLKLPKVKKWSLFDLSMRTLMTHIHMIEFETLPVSIIEDFFIPWVTKCDFFKNPDCPECWETLSQLCVSHNPENGLALARMPFGKMDFFSDEIRPVLDGLKKLDLSNSGIHDNSGILDIIAHSEIIEYIDLSRNALTTDGFRKFLRPSMVYSKKLKNLKKISICGNACGKFTLELFDHLTSEIEILFDQHFTR